MTKVNLLTISIIIPAYNEEKNLKRLLPSLKKQTYPKNKIEFIIIDDASTDNTYKLAKEFGARIISVKTHDIELNKGIGMYAAKNDLIYWLDADMEICSKDFFVSLVKPLAENPHLIGSFTKEFALDYQKPITNSFLRFISYDTLQCDPVYGFFSSSVQSTIIEQKRDYAICHFIPGKIPPAGRTLFRRNELLKTAVGKNKSFIDLETLEIVARAGHQYFAYVPKAKIRHYHSQSLLELIKKRPMRNLGFSSLGDQSGDYLPNIDKKHYLWFNSRDKKDAFKVIGWIIYANLFFPELIRGLFKSIKFKDHAFLWQPLASLLITDVIVWGFISRPAGRKLIIQVFKSLIKH